MFAGQGTGKEGLHTESDPGISIKVPLRFQMHTKLCMCRMKTGQGQVKNHYQETK